jgi:DNA-binding MarR family transcriptional regulator
VERVPDPADGRAKLVRATARGEEIYEIARQFVSETERTLTRKLGKRRMTELRKLLAELNEAL